MMRAAPRYRHPDVLTDMLNAVERASQRFNREAIHLVSPDVTPFLAPQR